MRRFCAFLGFEDLFGKISMYKMWPPVVDTPTPPPYRISTSPSKGKCMLATRPISSGELILRERATFFLTVIPRGDLPGLEKATAELLDMIDPVDKARFLALTNCKSPDLPLFGIIQTNSIGGYFPDSEFLGPYSGIFLDLARCNHRCVLLLCSILQ